MGRWRREDKENKMRIEKGKWRWRRVSGEIRMWDRNEEEKMEMKKIGREIRMWDRDGEGKMKMKKS